VLQSEVSENPGNEKKSVPAQVILVVDDEAKISQIVMAYLQRDGYRVLRAENGRVALDLARTEMPDLVVLDLMLPEVSGWDVCRALRRDAKTAEMPIIMLTARDEIADRIVGLELGADDYVVKPFDPKELVARVHAVLRRVRDRREAASAAGSPSAILRHGDLAIDRGRHEVRQGDRPLEVTRTEFELLATLAEQPGRVFSRLQLLDAIQGEAFEGYERTIDSHVKNLRRKLEPDPRRPRYIQTVFGIGYKLVDQDRPDPVGGP
jgi:DNA-binding response OmpR family regulator